MFSSSRTTSLRTATPLPCRQLRRRPSPNQSPSIQMAKAKVLSLSWEDLPPDLLGLLLWRLPSLRDRFRLRAVCRLWRDGAAAQRHPPLPPPLPWLALIDGGIVELNGAPVHCAPILRDGVDAGFLAVDNLVCAVHGDGDCSLMNPLCGLTLSLPELASAVNQALGKSERYNESYMHNTHVKAVMSSPLHSSSDSLLAILIMVGNGVAVSACEQRDASATTITICPGSPRIHDIAFLHGRLYALTQFEGHFVVELDASRHCSRLSQPNSSSGPGFHQCIADDPKQKEIYYTNPGQTSYYESYPEYLVMRYLAESNGRLLMVRRWMSIQPNAPLGDNEWTLRFEIFKVDLTTVPGQWIKVESLGSQALFLGSECSKSVLVGQCAGGVREDCIYFMHRIFDSPSKEFSDPCLDPLADSGVYNMKDGEIALLLPEPVMAELHGKRQFLTWFFPADP